MTNPSKLKLQQKTGEQLSKSIFGNSGADNKCVSPEKIILNQKYTLTINPNDAGQKWFSDIRQELSKADWDNYFNDNVNKYVRVKIFQEVSKAGRIHYHGTIEFSRNKGINEFFIKNIHELLDLCHYEIDTIDQAPPDDLGGDRDYPTGEEIWWNYCTKYQHIYYCEIDSSIRRPTQHERIQNEMDKIAPTISMLKFMGGKKS